MEYIKQPVYFTRKRGDVVDLIGRAPDKGPGAAQQASGSELKGVRGGVTVVALSNVVSKIVLAANENRRYLLIQNQDSANPLYFNFDDAAKASPLAGFVVPASGSVEMTIANTGALHMIGSVDGQIVSVMEGV